MIDGKLDQIMLEYNEKMKPVVNTSEAELEETLDETVTEE
jgi:hypothetical protein